MNVALLFLIILLCILILVLIGMAVMFLIGESLNWITRIYEKLDEIKIKRAEYNRKWGE